MSINLVKEFAVKYDLPMEPKPQFPEEMGEMDFRIDRMYDELHEFCEAYENASLVDAFDALLDLSYVVYGTALRMGISPDQWVKGFAEVHRANMQKVKVSNADQSKFGNRHDLRKPASWVGPEKALEKIIMS